MKGQENAEKNTNLRNIELGVLLKAANKSWLSLTVNRVRNVDNEFALITDLEKIIVV